MEASSGKPDRALLASLPKPLHCRNAAGLPVRLAPKAMVRHSLSLEMLRPLVQSGVSNRCQPSDARSVEPYQQTMTNTTRLSVPADRAIELLAQAGCASAQRASMLIALGLNSADQAADASFHLPGFLQFFDTSEEISELHALAFRDDYRSWMVGNGFRTLFEGLETFLDALFRLLGEIELELGHNSRSKIKKQTSNFERRGVAGKLAFLKEHYGLDTGHLDYLQSLTQARNCLTHRAGQVRDVDCGSTGYLELRWLGFSATIAEADGTVHEITLDTLGDIDSRRFSNDGPAKLTLKIVERALRFEEGENIDIKPRTLQEICFLFSFTFLKLHQLSVNWLLDLGMHVNGGNKMEEPKVTPYVGLVEPQDTR